MRLCHIYTEPLDAQSLSSVIKACRYLKLGFYYSDRQRVLRVSARNGNTIKRFQSEMKKLGIAIHRTYY